MKSNRSKAIKAIILSSLLVGTFIFTYLNVSREKELLNKYGVYTDCRVIKISGLKSRKNILFEFYVGGTKYTGAKKHYMSEGKIRVGEIKKVIYYPKDPTINRLRIDYSEPPAAN